MQGRFFAQIRKNGPLYNTKQQGIAYRVGAVRILGNVLRGDGFLVLPGRAFGPSFGLFQGFARLVFRRVFGVNAYVQHGPNVGADFFFKFNDVFRCEQMFASVMVRAE